MNNRMFILTGCRGLVLHDTHPRAGHDHAVGPCADDLERVRTGVTASRHDQFIAWPHLLFEPDPEPSDRLRPDPVSPAEYMPIANGDGKPAARQNCSQW